MSSEIRWIISYLNRYPLMFFLTIVLSIIEISLYSAPSIMVAQLMQLFIDSRPLSEVRVWIFYLLALVTLQAVVFYTVATINEIHAHRVTTDMTEDLFITLQQRPLYYHDSVRIGDVMARATGDTRIINIGISPAVRILVQITALLVGSLAIFVNLNWKLSLILFLTFPLFAYYVYLYGKKLGPISTEVQQAFGEMSVRTHELFRGIHELKSYTFEEEASNSFREMSGLHSQKLRRFGVLSSLYPPQLLMAVSMGSVAVYGVFLIGENELTFPELVVFLGLITTLMFMTRRIKWIATMTMRMMASARRLMDMMDADAPPLEFGNLHFDGLEGSIEFRDVSFRYREDRGWALHSINLEIPRGHTIAVVGGPGSGKSTFVRLLLRLYDPQEGSILVDGNNLRDYIREDLRRHFTSIEQDVHLFSDTIRENIAFGRPEASFEEVIRAAELAHADDFIREFKDGYETVIGERGVTLSGGQKQRIAIARALLMDPSVLIMDDASSALDAETEYRIQQAISHVLRTRTSVVITHRLSIIAEADQVVVFDAGKIVAVGPHRELLRTSSYYRRLFEAIYELPEIE